MIFRLLFGLGYTAGYAFLAIAAAAGGHGTFIFFAPLLTWVFLLAAVFLSNKCDQLLPRTVFIVLMVLHYAQISVFIRPVFTQGIDEHTVKMWEQAPVAQILIAAWYFAGQFIIWVLFVNGLRRLPKRPERGKTLLK